jgi:hypothetical protein
LPFATVTRLCHQESRRYLQRASHDPRFCYELFRRAIAGRDEQAWAALFTQYVDATPLVQHWITQHPLFAASGEEAAYFANRTFEKMWAALGPEKFARFADLAALLRYLKLCVNSVITDHVRARPDEVPLLETDAAPAGDPAGAPWVRLQRQELWRLIESRLHDEQERTAFYCRFDAGMKPAAIYAEHAALFADVKDVYRVLQNVLNRLRHDPALLAYVADG